jgi:carbonic anhydrase/acetyltransferase-like protein (isoleucine patch superfamily)
MHSLKTQVGKQLDRFLRRPPKLGQGVYIARGAVVLGDVRLGRGSSVWYQAVLRGDIHRIIVGHHTNIQDHAVLHLADPFPCSVGNSVTVGHSAVVHACTVGDETLVGIGAVILDGSVVGRQCLIGTKTLVTSGGHPRRFAGAGFPRQNRPRAHEEGAQRIEALGGEVCAQRRLLPEARDQRRRTAGDGLTSRQARALPKTCQR